MSVAEQKALTAAAEQSKAVHELVGMIRADMKWEDETPCPDGMIRFSPEEFIAKALAVDDALAALSVERFRQTLEPENKPYRVEAMADAADGSPLWIIAGPDAPGDAWFKPEAARRIAAWLNDAWAARDAVARARPRGHCPPCPRFICHAVSETYSRHDDCPGAGEQSAT